ncbi:MAG: hypothetical protein M5R36_14375 [Deltaproteobacteria bacterium]|nr:hypothetical protein [Deltaproteobacteria bacterium]
MNRAFLTVSIALLLAATGVIACDGGGSHRDEEVAPLLYQDSLRVDPNPAWLYEDATFYFAWEDGDGDMENPVVSVRLENEDEESRFVEIKNVEVDGHTGGAIWFDLPVSDGYEGRYFITVRDEAGRLSNEIELFLYVSPVPRIDEEDNEVPFEE